MGCFRLHKPSILYKCVCVQAVSQTKDVWWRPLSSQTRSESRHKPKWKGVQLCQFTRGLSKTRHSLQRGASSLELHKAGHLDILFAKAVATETTWHCERNVWPKQSSNAALSKALFESRRLYLYFFIYLFISLSACHVNVDNDFKKSSKV